MTEKKDLKARVRERMKKTGERYTAALAHIQPSPPAPPSPPPASAWHPLIETTRDEALQLVRRAIERLPRLTYFGVGIGEENRRRRELRAAGKSLAPLEEEFQKSQADLFSQNGLEGVAACADWVKRQRVVKRWTGSTSYGFKHAVEYWFDARSDEHLYVANGAFIAAALGLEMDYRVADWGSPNVVFKFSKATQGLGRAELREKDLARDAARRTRG